MFQTAVNTNEARMSVIIDTERWNDNTTVFVHFSAVIEKSGNVYSTFYLGYAECALSMKYKIGPFGPVMGLLKSGVSPLSPGTYLLVLSA